MANNAEGQGLEGSARSGRVAVGLSHPARPFLQEAQLWRRSMGWLSSNSQVEMN
jgi:hypothetical protein